MTINMQILITFLQFIRKTIWESSWHISEHYDISEVYNSVIDFWPYLLWLSFWFKSVLNCMLTCSRDFPNLKPEKKRNNFFVAQLHFRKHFLWKSIETIKIRVVNLPDHEIPRHIIKHIKSLKMKFSLLRVLFLAL